MPTSGFENDGCSPMCATVHTCIAKEEWKVSDFAQWETKGCRDPLSPPAAPLNQLPGSVSASGLHESADADIVYVQGESVAAVRDSTKHFLPIPAISTETTILDTPVFFY